MSKDTVEDKNFDYKDDNVVNQIFKDATSDLNKELGKNKEEKKEFDITNYKLSDAEIAVLFYKLKSQDEKISINQASEKYPITSINIPSSALSSETLDKQFEVYQIKNIIKNVEEKSIPAYFSYTDGIHSTAIALHKNKQNQKLEVSYINSVTQDQNSPELKNTGLDFAKRLASEAKADFIDASYNSQYNETCGLITAKNLSVASQLIQENTKISGVNLQNKSGIPAEGNDNQKNYFKNLGKIYFDTIVAYNSFENKNKFFNKSKKHYFSAESSMGGINIPREQYFRYALQLDLEKQTFSDTEKKEYIDNKTKSVGKNYENLSEVYPIDNNRNDVVEFIDKEKKIYNETTPYKTNNTPYISKDGVTISPADYFRMAVCAEMDKMGLKDPREREEYHYKTWADIQDTNGKHKGNIYSRFPPNQEDYIKFIEKEVPKHLDKNTNKFVSPPGPKQHYPIQWQHQYPIFIVVPAPNIYIPYGKQIMINSRSHNKNNTPYIGY